MTDPAVALRDRWGEREYGTRLTLLCDTPDRIVERDFRGAPLRGCVWAEITFDGFDFSGATLTNVDASRATFRRCIFADTSFQDCRFIEARFAYSDFSRARFTNCDFGGAWFDVASAQFSGDIRGALFDGATLRESSFARCIAKGVSFTHADLGGSNFTSATLDGCRFDGAFMKSADLSNASCRATSFVDASLLDSSLSGADLTGAVFDGCRLRDSSLAGAKLTSLDEILTSNENRLGRPRLREDWEGDFRGAAALYVQLNELMKAGGRREQAWWAYVRLRTCQRKEKWRAITALHGGPVAAVQWGLDWLKGAVFNYGEGVIRFFIIGALVLLASAFVYATRPGCYGLPQAKNDGVGPWATGLYYSAVTFATVGYGDYKPVRNWKLCECAKRPEGHDHHRWLHLIYQFWPAGEGLSGALWMSMFTVLVARRILRD